MIGLLRRIPWRPLTTLVMVAAGCGYLYTHRAQVGDLVLREGRVALPCILLAAAAGTVAGGLAWREVLAAIGPALPRLPALALFHSSQLGKYLPGGVGPVAAQVAWGRSMGATPALVMRSYLLTMLVSSASGLTAGALLMAPRWPVGGGCLAAAGGLVSALLLSRRGAGLLGRLLARLPRARALAIPAGTEWTRAYLLTGAGWLLLGSHVGVLLGQPPAAAMAAAGASICATVTGAAAIVLPGGLGAREGAFYWFLTRTAVAGSAGVTLALSSRMVTLLTDVALGLVASAALLHLRKGQAARRKRAAMGAAASAPVPPSSTITAKARSRR